MKMSLDFIVPSFADLGRATLSELLPGITDKTLREEILGNSRLHPKMLAQVFAKSKIDLEKMEAPAPQEDKVREIVGSDLPDLLLEIGAAYQANNLAELVAKGQLRLNETDIPRDVIKVALAHRSIAKPLLHGTSPKRACLEAEGHLCLSSWIDTLGKPYSTLVKLRLNSHASEMQSSRIARRVKVADTVLNVRIDRREAEA